MHVGQVIIIIAAGQAFTLSLGMGENMLKAM